MFRKVIFDLVCPWCFAAQKIPALGPPFRFYCGNCHDLLLFRSNEQWKAQYEEVQGLKRKFPRWRELEVPVMNSSRENAYREQHREKKDPIPLYHDRVKAFPGAKP